MSTSASIWGCLDGSHIATERGGVWRAFPATQPSLLPQFTVAWRHCSVAWGVRGMAKCGFHPNIP